MQRGVCFAHAVKIEIHSVIHLAVSLPCCQFHARTYTNTSATLQGPTYFLGGFVCISYLLHVVAKPDIVFDLVMRTNQR
jgi:hypothetical protein